MGHQNFAAVAELADALDLGSSLLEVGVQVSSAAPAMGNSIKPNHYFKVMVRKQIKICGSDSVARVSPCQGERRGFESRLPLQCAPLAQMVEQLTLNQWVQGSSP
jgi:hypothetical protein